jgi:drug/metabolite transporter (DMT)-like permease
LGYTLVAIIFAVLGAGIMNIINGFLTNYGFQHVEAVLASNILMLESPFALIIGLFFFREVPVMREMIGAALIAYGAWKINQSES